LENQSLPSREKKFDLMSVDDDRFGFYDQHGPDDIELGAVCKTLCYRISSKAASGRARYI
jgi:hypothetical protein